ncbi:MAG TPA: A/G-specific adenine glycosylase [Rhodanobacteraceae bacterium]
MGHALNGVDAFARALLDWYDHHGRHDLPWQHPRTPYRVWISEVMLQQTQVATVIPYFERFVQALPAIPALARADEDRVLALWSGLGYYRRARNLQAAAQRCVAQHGGALPRDFAALAALPGIGRSTAGAILALGYGERSAILDGNVKRVLTRVHGIPGWPGERAVEQTLWAHAIEHTPAVRVAAYTQAIMDLGATICTRRDPQCGRCPLRPVCVARRDQLTDSIPAARPARVLPERYRVFIVLRDPDERVLLERRPPQGVWPGLWSLPETDTAAAAGRRATDLADLSGSTPAELPVVRHTFTHFRLQATPIEWRNVQPRPVVADEPALRWCTPGDLANLGLPAPVRRLLAPSAGGAPVGLVRAAAPPASHATASTRRRARRTAF